MLNCEELTTSYIYKCLQGKLLHSQLGKSAV